MSWIPKLASAGILQRSLLKVAAQQIEQAQTLRLHLQQKAAKHQPGMLGRKDQSKSVHQRLWLQRGDLHGLSLHYMRVLQEQLLI